MPRFDQVVKGLLFWALALLSTLTVAQTLEQIFPSVPRIIVGNASGSGFAVSERHVVTNHHVIANAILPAPGQPRRVALPQVLIEIPGRHGQTFNATILAHDAVNDLAVLEVGGIRLQPLTLNVSMPRMSDEVTSLGYPGIANAVRGETLIPNFSRGPVANSPGDTIRRFGTAQIAHYAHAARGNSGGPLLNACMQVVGVNTKIVRDIDDSRLRSLGIVLPGGTTLSVATHIEATRNLLQQSGVTANTATRPCVVPQARQWPWVFAIVLSSAALLLALRRPRERIIRVVEQASRRVSDGVSSMMKGAFGAPPDANVLMVLSGFAAASGKPVRVPVMLPTPSKDPTRALSEFVIGRSAAVAHFTIDDASLSRRHARIFLSNASQPVVEDLNSTSGSYLNGARLSPLTPTPIHTGDTLMLGDLSLTVLAGGSASRRPV